MLTAEQKQKIIDAGLKAEKNFDSHIRFATAMGLNAAQWSRARKGELDGVLSSDKLLSLARKLGVNLSEKREVIPASTPVFQYIQVQLSACQKHQLSGILCDSADIGKTFAAKHYARTHKNAFYVDCSQCKSKRKLVRTMAGAMGLGKEGTYGELYENLNFFIETTPNPLFILDEIGDLEYSAFLELKALWNRNEYNCGWYMMGADGLKAKINRGLQFQKVGYAEMFSRLGNRFQRITPEGDGEEKSFAKKQIATIAKVNGIEDKREIQRLFVKTDGSLRRLHLEIQKMKIKEV